MMANAFAFNPIQEIKDKVRIEEAFRFYYPGVQLKAMGSKLKGLCPFHQEKTPSFEILPASGRFRCFGCGANGSVIDLAARYYGEGLSETIKKMQADFGLGRQLSEAEKRRIAKEAEERRRLQEERELEARAKDQVYGFLADIYRKNQLVLDSIRTPKDLERDDVAIAASNVAILEHWMEVYGNG